MTQGSLVLLIVLLGCVSDSLSARLARRAVQARMLRKPLIAACTGCSILGPAKYNHQLPPTGENTQ